MLPCIVCSKKPNNNNKKNKDASLATDHLDDATPITKHPIKGLRAQIKGMVIKASGSYKKPKPNTGFSDHNHIPHQTKNYAYSDAGSEPAMYQYSFSPTGSSNSTPRMWEKNTQLKSPWISSGALTPASVSSRMELLFLEEDEPKEWVAQVEPGILIIFVSMPGGGNDLKRIRFSREMFDKGQAQRWWAENYDKVMELYNVQRLNQQAFPLSNPARSEEEGLKIESSKESPMTLPPRKESPPNNFPYSSNLESSSSDALDQHSLQYRHNYDSVGHASIPKLSSISGVKTEASSIDGSARTSSWRKGYSGEASLSNVSDMETQWVEQDEPGVYITITTLPDGTRELRRVRFSREKFGEKQARRWWEENKARIQQQYL